MKTVFRCQRFFIAVFLLLSMASCQSSLNFSFGSRMITPDLIFIADLYRRVINYK